MAILEYHQVPFLELGRRIGDSFDPDRPPRVRRNYWRSVPVRDYTPEEARPLLLSYLAVATASLQGDIAGQSLRYWIHVYRRLAPRPIGPNRSPVTTGLVRATLECAFQKYGRVDWCDRLAVSTEVAPDRILGGLLQELGLRPIIEELQKRPQVVLTHFGVPELRDMLNLERRAYEVWSAMAMLRANGKGIGLRVLDDGLVEEISDDTIDQLLVRYDERLGTSGATSKGIPIERLEPADGAGGSVYLPVYNVWQQPAEMLNPLIRGFTRGGVLPPDLVTNFFLSPLNLASLYAHHRPLERAFESQHGVSLRAVLGVLERLYRVLIVRWARDPGAIVRTLARAYELFKSRRHLLDDLHAIAATGHAAIGIDDIEAEEMERALEFWTLGAVQIERLNPGLAGPHAVVLPGGRDGLLVDYAWWQHRLRRLFHGLRVTDEGWKGALLEQAVQSAASPLPSAQLVAMDGTARQVDAAFGVASTLVIAECKMVEWSLGFERGDPESIAFRRRKVVDRSLAEADEKARWLASHPRGRNYDIRAFRSILPIGVSPFTEYIHSLDEHYWLTATTPRVLSPAELEDLVRTGQFERLGQTHRCRVAIGDGAVQHQAD